MTRASVRRRAVYACIQFNLIQFISFRCTHAMHSFGRRSFRVNRAIDDRPRGNPLPTRTDRRPRRRSVERKSPPDAYKKNPRRARPPISQPIDVGRALARACTPSLSMRVPPSMRVPWVHTYPIHPPSQRFSTRRSGHVHGTRTAEMSRRPLATQKKKKKNIPTTPLKMQKYTPTGGQSSSYSTHTRVRQIPARTRVRDG